MTKVNIAEVQKIASFLLSSLRKQKGDEIELKNDFYWDISSNELYKPYKEPTDISLGQLSDDLEEVQRLSLYPEEAISYDLKRIAEIIKALSIENPASF